MGSDLKASPPQRILVREVNWLGDVVMTLPALRSLRTTYPTAHLAVLVRP
ncbi:MAG: lipopolysaccharide heptosyltransferase II, partial [Deltaproteobacteria bacterium]|nr:lipopolysaccharide heptosyltransferase II [Deltaproteobacteria bacterium]